MDLWRDALQIRLIRALFAAFGGVVLAWLIQHLWKGPYGLSLAVGLVLFVVSWKAVSVGSFLRRGDRPPEAPQAFSRGAELVQWSPSVRKIEQDKALKAVERIVAQRIVSQGSPEAIWQSEIQEYCRYLARRLGELGMEPPEGLEKEVLWADRTAAATQDYPKSLARALAQLVERQAKAGR
ncbi:MAG: hypothetical protein ACP5VF_09995 [Acidobacteriota bacterium]